MDSDQVHTYVAQSAAKPHGMDLFASNDSEQLDDLVNDIGDAIVVVDTAFTVVSANHRFACLIHAATATALLGKPLFELMPEFQHSAFHAACLATMETGYATSRIGFSSEACDWLVLRCTRLPRPDRYAIVTHALSASMDKGGYTGRNDPLTALPNRVAFETDARNSGWDENIAAAVIDLSHFGALNKALGVDAGDRCLMEVATHARHAAGELGHVYRIGDDEFLFVTQNGDASLHSMLNEMARLLDGGLVWRGVVYSLRFNVGWSAALAGANATETVARALRALAMAKSKRLPVCAWHDTMEDGDFPLDLIREMQAAMDTGELVPYLQPQIHLATGRLCGAEILVRWRHPRLGVLAPDRFLPIAEEMGLLPRIDLAMACAGMDILNDPRLSGIAMANAGFYLSSNLSAQSLCDAHTAANILSAAKSRAITPSRFCFEITETSTVADVDGSKTCVNTLRDAGFGIAIDDFGSGYAAMGYLVRYPVGLIKIDRDFIHDLVGSQPHSVMVRNAIELAHGLGAKVTAEGVENTDQINQLRGYGCDMGQGYCFSRPLPLDDFFEWAAGFKGLVAQPPSLLPV